MTARLQGSTRSQSEHKVDISDHLDAPAALLQRNIRTGTHRIGGFCSQSRSGGFGEVTSTGVRTAIPQPSGAERREAVSR